MKFLAILKSANFELAVCALRVQAGDEKQRLIPAGKFDAPRGAMSGQGPWLLTEAAAKRVIALAATRGTDIVIDYEHQTLLAEKNGQPAPAAGWVDPKSLEWREDGLYGTVSWNTAAAKAINDDEYRYLSPVFPYDRQTGEVLNLLHLALTNTPAIDDAANLLAAARSRVHCETNEDNTVDRDELIALLGLEKDASDEDIKAGLAALKAAQTELAALREGLAVEDGGNAVEAVAVLKGKADNAKPDMNKYVPRAVYEETQAQLAALKAGGDESEIESLIKEGLEDGRIAGKATAEFLREQGLAVLKAHLEDAPVVAALKGKQTQDKKPEGDDAEKPSDELVAVCSQMGLSADDVAKAS